VCGDKDIVGGVRDKPGPLATFDFPNGFRQKFVVGRGRPGFGVCKFNQKEVAEETYGGRA